MKASISKTKAKKALVELREAMTHLGDIRPSEAMETEEFFELCSIRGELNVLVSQLDKLLKGGQS